MASNELFKLSQERHEKTYAWILEDIFTQNHAPKPVDKEKQPRIIVVAAQPGAGKSHLLDQSKEEFMKEDGVIVINGDELRDYHPKATEIMKLDDKRYAEFTDPDSREWTRRLLEDVTKRRHNVIFECTFNNPGPIMATMQRLHEQGYDVQVKVMAVPREISRLGIEYRYERDKANSGYSRYTDPKYHDEAYGNFIKTLEKVEKESPITRISVHTREKEVYRNSRAAPDKEWENPRAAEIARGERGRALSEKDLVFLSEGWERVIEWKKQRGATAKEVEVAAKEKQEIDIILQRRRQSHETNKGVKKKTLHETPFDTSNHHVFQAKDDRVYNGKIVAVQKDKVFQEIAPGTLVEHKRSSVGPISAADTGKTFSISYEGKRTVTVKDISWLRERGGVER